MGNQRVIFLNGLLICITNTLLTITRVTRINMANMEVAVQVMATNLERVILDISEVAEEAVDINVIRTMEAIITITTTIMVAAAEEEIMAIRGRTIIIITAMAIKTLVIL